MRIACFIICRLKFYLLRCNKLRWSLSMSDYLNLAICRPPACLLVPPADWPGSWGAELSVRTGRANTRIIYCYSPAEYRPSFYFIISCLDPDDTATTPPATREGKQGGQQRLNLKMLPLLLSVVFVITSASHSITLLSSQSSCWLCSTLTIRYHKN